MIKKHSFTLLPFVRVVKGSAGKLQAIYLRITVDGGRTEISTKCVTEPSKWNPAKGRVNGNTEEARIVNQSIISFEHRAREVYNRCIESGKLVTADLIKDEVLGTTNKSHTLVDQFDLHVADIEAKKGVDFAKGTVTNWKITQGHLKEFLQKKCKRVDIPLKDLGIPFLADFDFYAKTVWKCGNNASLKHIQRIRAVVNLAVIKGFLEKDPFLGFKGKKDKSNRTFLTAQELAAIQNRSFDMQRLERVKDMFIFSCYTGLAYVDMQKLTADNVVIGIDSYQWIYTFRTKTKVKSNVPLLPSALAILEKYKNEPDVVTSGRLLPMITNIKTNAYLKELADICGIKKNLTFHMARHTFATTVALSNGVPIETVSKILGHTKVTTTQIYAKVLENKVSADMEMLRQKMTGQGY
jgi:integrase